MLSSKPGAFLPLHKSLRDPGLSELRIEKVVLAVASSVANAKALDLVKQVIS
jgi:hypothetical protein